jgi:hypothetical protein
MVDKALQDLPLNASIKHPNFLQILPANLQAKYEQRKSNQSALWPSQLPPSYQTRSPHHQYDRISL